MPRSTPRNVSHHCHDSNPTGAPNGPQNPWRRRAYGPACGLAIVLTLGGLIRAGALFVLQDHLHKDPDGYRVMAETLAEHHVLGRIDYFNAQGDETPPVHPTAYRPPLYPIVLSAVAVICNHRAPPLGVALLHWTLGVATIWLTVKLGQLAGLRRGAYLAAMLTACDPILLFQSAQVMTETLAVFLAACSLVLLGSWDQPGPLGRQRTRPLARQRTCPWRKPVLSGFLMGLAALCRPTFYVWLALGAAVIAVKKTPGSSRRRNMTQAVLLIAGGMTAVAPWAVRNTIHFGRPILATTHGGHTLWLGNNASFFRHIQEAPLGAVWDVRESLGQWDKSQPLAAQGARPEEDFAARELAQDRRWRLKAWEDIRQQPRVFGHACLLRLARLWTPLPHQGYRQESAGRRLLRYSTAIWYIAVYIAAAVGFFRGPWRPTGSGRKRLPGVVFWGLLLCLAVSIVHTVYWSNMRMRAPLVPVISLLAGAALVRPGPPTRN